MRGRSRSSQRDPAILAIRKRHGATGPFGRVDWEPAEEGDVILADRGFIEEAEEWSRDALEDAGPRRLVFSGIRVDRGFETANTGQFLRLRIEGNG